MALKKKAGGMENVLIVIHHQDAGVRGRSSWVHVFACGQVSGFVYASGQEGSNPICKYLNLLALTLAQPLRYKVSCHAAYLR
jgi:hypothetical protein